MIRPIIQMRSRNLESTELHISYLYVYSKLSNSMKFFLYIIQRRLISRAENEKVLCHNIQLFSGAILNFNTQYLFLRLSYEYNHNFNKLINTIIVRYIVDIIY